MENRRAPGKVPANLFISERGPRLAGSRTDPLTKVRHLASPDIEVSPASPPQVDGRTGLEPAPLAHDTGVCGRRAWAACE